MESQVEIIQINIAGKDQPGLTSSLTDILARYDAFILDIGQANIHQSLNVHLDRSSQLSFYFVPTIDDITYSS